MTIKSADSERNLVDELIAEQQSLTAVARFAQKHSQANFHAQSRYYEALIPLSKPAPGQQYAFAVDLDKCTGCKSCVSACHSLNGLEENETWRDVGLLVGGHRSGAYQQTVTTACHHCLEPGCLEGCPVMAYDKDAETGIVRHLDDQCIGCQYCTMKCPYDVPKYSKSLGIVRKCDMCHDRLAVGEAPACVQACPHEAIAIRLVDVEAVSTQSAPGTQLLPSTFDSSYTKPTTTYTTARRMPVDVRAADTYAFHLEHAHWPLIIMLLLSQCAVGLSVFLAVASFLPETLFRTAGLPLALAGFGLLNVGLIAALFHLGRPLGAWRFFLGLRTSWMSREILAFSIYAGASSFTIIPALICYPLTAQFLPPAIHAFIQTLPLTLFAQAICLASLLFGLTAVFTSAMIYVDTHRSFWRSSRTFPRFYLATMALGAGATSVILSWLSAPIHLTAALTLVFGGTAFAWEMSRFSDSFLSEDDPDHHSARTIHKLLPWFIPTRSTLFIAWAALLAGSYSVVNPAYLVTGAFSVQLIGQVMERYAFFSSVVALRMPRGI
jgi:Fe-S-cluster-containing dehydrogenase component/DMSO reductase anchor subunit